MFEGIKKKLFTQEFLNQDQQPEEVKPETPPPPAPKPPKPTPAKTVTVTLDDDGPDDTDFKTTQLTPEADKDMKDKIYSLLSKINKEGTDFFEVWDATEQLDGGVNAANIRSAFTVLKAASGNKLTKAFVLETAQYYKSQLEAALQSDTKAKSAEKQQLSTQLSGEKSSLQQQVDDLTKQIADLTAKKEDAEGKLDKIDGKYAPSIQKIDQKIAAGKRAVQSVSQEIQSFIDIFTEVIK